VKEFELLVDYALQYLCTNEGAIYTVNNDKVVKALALIKLEELTSVSSYAYLGEYIKQLRDIFSLIEHLEVAKFEKGGFDPN
jgi:hypothetical protein